jgi:hypothetical protein
LIVDTVEAAVEAVGRLNTLDRSGVRRCFERRFTVERMAADYLDIYRSLPGVRLEAAHLRRVNGAGSGLHAAA